MKGQGFVNACELWTGEVLLDSEGTPLTVENTIVELSDTPVTVYSFQVKDFHTYHVGLNCVFVHNAGEGYSGNKYKKVEDNSKNGKEFEPGEIIPKGTPVITIRGEQ